MARTKGPLFSVSASGDFRGVMEFRSGGGRTIVAGAKQSHPARTAAQQAQAQKFTRAKDQWNLLSADARQVWRTAAQGMGVTGYQLYISEYINQNVTPPDQPTPP